ncbi:hypothetical protein GON03_02345 [Nocardioides sp. MAH-18]|uniref:Acetoacetate decarboxylase n=1 Tax=Nocardioides agri TaxID=2682843 RepID=A0A6L6XMP5_9ACTN|nr:MULTISPECIES: hypothetical protein [unclassified Nocardioides]MBA2953134.1 hypothetical protein [Nocardioides sp. CGMCC 1.13656]MVQ48003.1 hypothetical protein [Nocardioides sp. MAH-18]
MVSIRQAAAAATAAASALCVSSPATAAPSSMLHERDCVEVTLPRAVDSAETRALVPSRYDLTPLVGPNGIVAARLWVYTYTCESITVDGVPAHGADGRSTVSIGAVQVAARDGEPVDGFATYVLWYATDDPVAFAHLRARGWPAERLTADTEATLDIGAAGAPSAGTWRVDAPGVAYKLRAVSTEPAPEPVDGGISFFHDGHRGDLEMAVSNEELATSPAALQADFRRAGPLPDLLLNPANAVIPAGVGINDDGIYSAPMFIYARGSWTSEVRPAP